MVQGSKHAGAACTGAFSKDPSARKASYEAIRKHEQEKKAASNKNENQNKYGAWGPVYKNKQHFAEMHFC